MRLSVLMENTARDPSLAAEHGLSLLIETEQYKILFDAGQSGAFADNAAQMGVDLGTVDFAVLSHGHYDHGGGLCRFLMLCPDAPVYVNQNAFGSFHNAAGKYIGLPTELSDSDRVIPVGDVHSPGPGVTLFSCNKESRPCFWGSFGLTKGEGDLRRPDDFLHEQYLLIEEAGRRVVFCGCAHKGVLNILRWLRPDVLVGGFHFRDLDPAGPGRQTLEDAARILQQSGAVFYTGHCTGQAQYGFLKEILGDNLQPLFSGAVYQL